MKTLPAGIRGVFFDLDGTLLDSAPDLYAALQAQCAEEGVVAPSYDVVRAVVSRGATAVLRCAFAARGEVAVAQLMPRYLALYQAVMAQQTRTFAGIDELLARIEACGWAWGIVTTQTRPGASIAGLRACGRGHAPRRVRRRRQPRYPGRCGGRIAHRSGRVGLP